MPLNRLNVEAITKCSSREQSVFPRLAEILFFVENAWKLQITLYTEVVFLLMDTVGDEASIRKSKVCFAFVGLRHLWRRQDRLFFKGRVYTVAIRVVCAE